MRSRSLTAVALLGLVSGLAVAGAVVFSASPQISFTEHCTRAPGQNELNPYYAAALLSGYGNDPSVAAFRDTGGNRIADRIPLSGFSETGSVFGLAYDWRRGHLYAGAFHQWYEPFGPGGPGAVYRLDLDTGDVLEWARVDAGTDHHGPDLHTPRTTIRDFDGIPWAGKASLGDLELDEAGASLYLVNLHDRRIHRFAVPDGQALGAFDIGSAGEPWAQNARPFGLAFKGGMLYHGVVDSREDDSLPGALRAYIYRSRPDGRDMREVARLDLTYGTQPPAWEPWVSEPLAERWPTPPFPEPDGQQPIVTDIELDRGGALALGLRNRVSDMYWPLRQGGDLIQAVPTGTSFEARALPEHYMDDTADSQEPLRGGLAVDPPAARVVAAGDVPPGSHSASLWAAIWFDHVSGVVGGPDDGIEYLMDNESRGIGDIELLCPPEYVPTPFPSVTPSPTSSPTSTATPEATLTATATATATASRTPTPARIYLPSAMRGHCRPVWLDVVLVLDMSTSMSREDAHGVPKHEAAAAGARRLVDHLELDMGAEGDRVAVVGFNDTAWLGASMTDSSGEVLTALQQLPERMAEGTRLDLALLAARDALVAAQTTGARLPIVVMLTDGLPNRVPTPESGGSQEDTVRSASRSLHETGAVVYAVGLGRPDDLDEPLLQAIAGDPDRYYRAADASVLDEVYESIAREIICGR